MAGYRQPPWCRCHFLSTSTEAMGSPEANRCPQVAHVPGYFAAMVGSAPTSPKSSSPPRRSCQYIRVTAPVWQPGAGRIVEALSSRAPNTNDVNGNATYRRLQDAPEAPFWRGRPIVVRRGSAMSFCARRWRPAGRGVMGVERAWPSFLLTATAAGLRHLGRRESRFRRRMRSSSRDPALFERRREWTLPSGASDRSIRDTYR